MRSLKDQNTLGGLGKYMHVCTYVSAYPHETSYRKKLCGFGKYNCMYGYPKGIKRISALSATAWPALMLKLEWQWEYFLEEYPRREVESKKLSVFGLW